MRNCIAMTWFADALRSHMARCGLRSQNDLADFLGEDRVKVHRWLGGSMPDPDKQEHVLKRLGGDIRRALPDWQPEKPQPPNLQDGMPVLGTIAGLQLVLDLPAIQERAEAMHVADGGQDYGEAFIRDAAQPFAKSDAWKVTRGGPFFLRVLPSSELERFNLANGGLLLFRAMAPKATVPPGPHRLCLMKEGKGLRLTAIGCTSRDGLSTFTEIELDSPRGQLAVSAIPAKKAVPAFLSVGAMINT